MDIEKFIELRPYLYHLTDESNLDSIVKYRILKSTRTLVEEFGIAEGEQFLRTRRIGHKLISKGKQSIMIRDQDPLSLKILSKNLEGGWSIEDFIYSINSRVFLWATEKDLRIHYKRYENQKEYPKVLCFSTRELFDQNENKPLFCRLNSGAPRCSCYYEKGAPPRGASTFQIAEEYEYVPSSVREITFLNACKLPEEIYLSSHPGKPFHKL